MRLTDAITKAHQDQDGRAAHDIAEFMYHRFGVDYPGMMRMVAKLGIDPNDWEALLYEGESCPE